MFCTDRSQYFQTISRLRIFRTFYRLSYVSLSCRLLCRCMYLCFRALSFEGNFISLLKIIYLSVFPFFSFICYHFPFILKMTTIFQYNTCNHHETISTLASNGCKHKLHISKNRLMNDCNKR